MLQRLWIFETEAPAQLYNKFLLTFGNFPQPTQTHNLHVALKKLCTCVIFLTKLCRQQAEVMQKHEK